MRYLLAIAAMLSADAALACSCMAPDIPEASRANAREAARNAVAIVEVDVLSEYRPPGRGELVRVRRVLHGRAPRTFRIQRSDFASSASCDLLLAHGQRKVLILSRPAGSRVTGRSFAIQSLCSDYLTSDRYLAVTLQEARRRR